MAGAGTLRVVLIAAIALYVFSYEGSCHRNDAKAGTKAPATDPTSNALRVNLIRRDSALSPFGNARYFSTAERLHRAIQRSHNRLHSFQNAAVSQQKGYYSPINHHQSEFLMQVEIGSPVPLNLHFILDTGSDLIWTQCEPCEDSCVSQEDPIYNPSRSSSFKNDSCSSVSCKAANGDCDAQKNCEYSYIYGDFSMTAGNMAYETFSLRIAGTRRQEATFPGISFGCGRTQGGDFSKAAGVIGMGRGPLSLVSQIGSSINNVFSYCLGSIHNASVISPLFFGNTPLASLRRRRVVPLLQNKANPTFYYVALRGMSVAGKMVNIPKGTFRIAPNGDGGVIIDSGTTLTYLVDAAYRPFLEAVRASIPDRPVNESSLGFDLCYHARPAPRFPIVAFHFEGGTRYVLAKKNTFVSVHQGKPSLVCLAFGSAGAAGTTSILGNIQQQNVHITYDLGQNKLYFARTKCASLRYG